MTDHDIGSINYFDDIIQYMLDDERSIVPVISNSLRLEEIFRDDAELHDLIKKYKIEFYDEAYTIDQQLTKAWAASNEYPMSDDHNLARVAQYRQVVLDDDPEQAKMEYLNFLNQRLLKNRQNKPKPGYEDIVAKFQKGMQPTRFTKNARELDMPDTFPEGKEDPLRLLARLPFSIYITTSYFSFLEEALIIEKREPSTQVWSWGEKANIKPEHLPNRDYDPTFHNPVVYHLFGLENYAKSLVLSEDDYLDFLMNSASAISSSELIPSPLRTALSQSRLLLLGYHLRDWDFRALIRFILEFRRPENKAISIALQPKLILGDETSEEKSVTYLEKYFKGHKFKVRWIDAESYIYGLSDAWRNRG